MRSQTPRRALENVHGDDRGRAPPRASARGDPRAASRSAREQRAGTQPTDNADREQRVAHRMPLVEGARRQPEERRGGDHESRALHQRQIERDAGGHQRGGTPSRAGARGRLDAMRAGSRCAASNAATAEDHEAGQHQQRIRAGRWPRARRCLVPARACSGCARTRASSRLEEPVELRRRRGSDRSSDSARELRAIRPIAPWRRRFSRDERRSRGADAGRRDERAPVLELDVDPLLAQRRRVQAWQALGARDRRARARCPPRSAARTPRGR